MSFLSFFEFLLSIRLLNFYFSFVLIKVAWARMAAWMTALDSYAIYPILALYNDICDYAIECLLDESATPQTNYLASHTQRLDIRGALCMASKLPRPRLAQIGSQSHCSPHSPWLELPDLLDLPTASCSFLPSLSPDLSVSVSLSLPIFMHCRDAWQRVCVSHLHNSVSCMLVLCT